MLAQKQQMRHSSESGCSRGRAAALLAAKDLNYAFKINKRPPVCIHNKT